MIVGLFFLKHHFGEGARFAERHEHRIIAEAYRTDAGAFSSAGKLACYDRLIERLRSIEDDDEGAMVLTQPRLFGIASLNIVEHLCHFSHVNARIGNNCTSAAQSAARFASFSGR